MAKGDKICEECIHGEDTMFRTFILCLLDKHIKKSTFVCENFKELKP